MTTNNISKIDFSKITLIDVVKLITKQTVPFSELADEEKAHVLSFINEKNIQIKVFKEKWFSVFENKFFAVEYYGVSGAPNCLFERTFDFESFSEFFQFVSGDIYDGTCLYGYEFSRAEIEKFNLDVGRLNFTSLITKNIDDYSFEILNSISEKTKQEIVKKAKAVNQWLNKLRPISSLKVLEAKERLFISKFGDSFETRIFSSFVLRRDVGIIKNAAIEYACKNDNVYGISFNDILMTYGRNEALLVIEQYKGKERYSTNRKWIRRFKDSLAGFDSGTFQRNRSLGFDERNQFYFVIDRYSNSYNFPINLTYFFSSFDELVSFVDGNLFNGDFSKAPLSREEIELFKINEGTKFPLAKTYSSYQIEKKFEEGKFIVVQSWFDTKGLTLLTKEHKFLRFFDFLYFLKGDLSNADLLFCEGLEKIPSLSSIKLTGVKVRSEIGDKLGLKMKMFPKERLLPLEFPLAKQNELVSLDFFMANHPENDECSHVVSYISDIHLLHRFKANNCKTDNDCLYYLKNLAKKIAETASYLTLIGGDTSTDFDTFRLFVKYLKAFHTKGIVLFTLGNHELWNQKNKNLEMIFSRYRDVLFEEGEGQFHLLQNNLFVAKSKWEEITELDLQNMSSAEIRERTKDSYSNVFGGIGFAGKNCNFNAKNGIYRGTISRETEKTESNKFCRLYEKVTLALKGRNLVVLTHMPMSDWGEKDFQPLDGVVYISGHNHRNFFFDDGKKRIFSDNQIGYDGKNVSLKSIPINNTYDWFAEYKDGIFEISKSDYEKYYRGIRQYLEFSRPYSKIFLVKREGIYMFFMETPKGTLVILNGGSIKKAGNHSLEYFYESMLNYSKSIKLFLSKYDSFEKQLSKEVSKIGGYGNIHGSIIDIDFYNHIFINPFDGSLTPYFANSMTDKYVYSNIPSLLKFQCPDVYNNYRKFLIDGKSRNALIISNGDQTISDHTVLVLETIMYKISRIINGLQFTTKYNVIRIWNDEIASVSSEENGKLLVSNIITPYLEENF